MFNNFRRNQTPGEHQHRHGSKAKASLLNGGNVGSMRLCNVNTICLRTFLPAGEVKPVNKGPRCPDNGPVGKLLLLAVLSIVTTAASQNTSVIGSVPSGPASNEVLRLTLRDAINMALRYNLGAIESGENAQITRGQRLIALSALLPQVSAGVSENVAQTSLATSESDTCLAFRMFSDHIATVRWMPALAKPYSASNQSSALRGADCRAGCSTQLQRHTRRGHPDRGQCLS